ncbi:polysaccharide lyase family 14 protein [Hydnomerulius pinastri MD-312]|uniref:Polysaccharide lyase family 14 protein n=1 Tax=Hydnomerulius pinastri MD-312 TaxID=994086 RepID=A0A0C9VYF9_9AGAM|nr:polysaccharide lyase family 14 protein [Hydnomerulius pinastri MD-312]
MHRGIMIFNFFILALVVTTTVAAPAGSTTNQAPDPTPSKSAQSVATTSFSSNTSASVGTIPSTSIVPTFSPAPLTSSMPSLSSTLLATKVVTDFETTTLEVTPTLTTTIVVVVTSTVVVTPTPAWSNRTGWTAPPQMTDLTAFNVTYFPSGQQNVAIVAKVPHVIALSSKPAQVTCAAQNCTNQSSTLQLVYPAHSVNPGSKPAGGADFYATPLNLSGALNVTLEYEVFFPADFDWVKGGKLPGLYGGHTGCSGGASARDCFSTRLMWRPNGVGELYLYAPKDKQTKALCSDPQSVCDASYGLSVGRGSFGYNAGNWTRLQQNVVLNTPGKQDGVFTLFVDGKPVINRTDVFYRDVPAQAKQKPIAKTPQASSKPSPSPGGILGPLLGGILKRQTGSLTQRVMSRSPTGKQIQTITVIRSPVLQTVAGNTLVEMAYPTVAPDAAVVLDDNSSGPAEFIGLFFSTFFGGHGEQYATPKEQYAWFKDFAITRHA